MRTLRAVFGAGSSRFRSLLFVGYIVLSSSLLLGYFLVPPGMARDTWYQAVGLAGLAAIALGAYVYRPRIRWPWLLLCGSLIASFIGDGIYAVQERMLGGEVPFPGLADPAYLAAYPMAAAALWGFIRVGGGARRATLLDAAITTVVGALLLWRFVIGLYFGDGTDSPAAQVASAAYPVGDLLLIAFVVRLMIGARGANPSLWLLVLGASSALVADVVYARLELTSGYLSGSLVDAGWLAQYLLYGAAALHPQMRDLGGEIETDFGGRGRMLLLGVVGLVSPLLMLLDEQPRRVDTIALSLANVALVLLVVARMWELVSRLTRSLEERLTLSVALQRQADSDALTGLPNRTVFARTVQRTLADRDALVAFLDLDEFKTINDGYGHGVGDELLVAVAERLQSSLAGEGELVARLGGDEFGVLVEATAPPVVLGERLLAVLDRPFRLSSGTVRVGASIGVARAAAGSGYSAVLADADVAMYTAKRRGKHQVAVFEPAQRELVLRDPELAAALTDALERGQLVVHYQPVVSVEDGSVIALEALVRWQRPGHGLLVPADFLPVAEASGLVVEIDAWVLATATANLARWREQAPDLRCSVNLSGVSVRVGGLADRVDRALTAAGLSADALVLEITEQVLIDDRAIARTELERLSGAGVTIALDDFGTGYSSLSYLQEFPVDVLKLDQRFVTTAGADAEGSALLRAAIRLGQTLGLQVVAEGVETHAQWAGLRDLGCEFAQGYLFAPPLDAVRIDELLTSGRGRALYLIDQGPPADAPPSTRLPGAA